MKKIISIIGFCMIIMFVSCSIKKSNPIDGVWETIDSNNTYFELHILNNHLTEFNDAILGNTPVLNIDIVEDTVYAYYEYEKVDFATYYINCSSLVLQRKGIISKYSMLPDSINYFNLPSVNSRTYDSILVNFSKRAMKKKHDRNTIL